MWTTCVTSASIHFHDCYPWNADWSNDTPATDRMYRCDIRYCHRIDFVLRFCSRIFLSRDICVISIVPLGKWFNLFAWEIVCLKLRDERLEIYKALRLQATGSSKSFIRKQFSRRIISSIMSAIISRGMWALWSWLIRKEGYIARSLKIQWLLEFSNKIEAWEKIGDHKVF